MLEIKTVLELYKNLVIGQKVAVRWTNCGYYMAGVGEVTKINKKSAVVVLTEAVSGPHGNYPVGQKLRLSTYVASVEWSWQNGIFPLETANVR